MDSTHQDSSLTGLRPIYIGHKPNYWRHHLIRLVSYSFDLRPLGELRIHHHAQVLLTASSTSTLSTATYTIKMGSKHLHLDRTATSV